MNIFDTLKNLFNKEFSKENLTTLLNSGAFNAPATAVGGMLGGAISGGLLSGVGNVFSGLGSAASLLPGMTGLVGGTAFKLLGGITNRFIGTKLNKENIAAVENSNAALRNVVVNLSSADSLMNQYGLQSFGMGFDLDFIGKNSILNKGATKEFNSLLADRGSAITGLENNYANANMNIENNVLGEQLAHNAAYGGPIHINPANRGKFNATKRRTGKTTEELTHSDNPLTRKRAIFAQNAAKWHHAFGGELGTNGADFSNGLVFINNGGSHEENPYGGVMMGVDQEGTPNTVEEGEVIKGDYVFSDRSKVPKAVRNKYKLKGNKPLTFAAAVKKLSKESEERPNDPISLRGLDASLMDLMVALEQLRQKDLPINMAALGGRINRFSDGGGFKEDPVRFISKLLGFKTKSEYDNWVKDNELSDVISNLVSNPSNIDSFKDKVATLNPRLAHAMSQGYNPFINLTISNDSPLSFDFQHGGWGDEGYNAWKESTDPAWLAAHKGYKGDGSDFNVAEKLMATDEYKRGTEWLQSSEENRRRYLLSILQSSDAPAAAKRHAKKFINDDGNWKEEANKDYETIYGTVRTTHPGTYWKTPLEMLRTPSASNFLVNEDGSVEELYDTTGFTAMGTPYTWGDADHDYTYNYFTASTPKPGVKPESEVHIDLTKGELDYPGRDNWLRYAPLFGNAIGLGMTAFSKPDESSANAILEATKTNAGKYRSIGFKPVGNYLTYRPQDMDMIINPLNANAASNRRNILNTSGGNRGIAMAGLTTADNNTLNAVGQARLQVGLANRQHGAETEDFNRKTNMFNSEGLFKADEANQRTAMQNADFALRGTMEAEKLRQNARLARENAISANLTALFDNMGAIGQLNVINSQYDWGLTHGAFAPSQRRSAKGGKLKRRKGYTL